MKKIKFKKIKNKKKMFIILGFCVLLLITGGVNLYLNSVAESSETAPVNAYSSSSFFTTFKTNRTANRSEEILHLDSIINNSNSSKDAIDSAIAEKANIQKILSASSTIESRLEAKGYNEVAVSAVSSNLSVMVRSDGLTEGEVAQILDVVLNSSDYTFDNIKIIEV